MPRHYLGIFHSSQTEAITCQLPPLFHSASTTGMGSLVNTVDSLFNTLHGYLYLPLNIHFNPKDQRNGESKGLVT